MSTEQAPPPYVNASVGVYCGPEDNPPDQYVDFFLSRGEHSITIDGEFIDVVVVDDLALAIEQGQGSGDYANWNMPLGNPIGTIEVVSSFDGEIMNSTGLLEYDMSHCVNTPEVIVPREELACQPSCDEDYVIYDEVETTETVEVVEPAPPVGGVAAGAGGAVLPEAGLDGGLLMVALSLVAAGGWLVRKVRA